MWAGAGCVSHAERRPLLGAYTWPHRSRCEPCAPRPHSNHRAEFSRGTQAPLGRGAVRVVRLPPAGAGGRGAAGSARCHFIRLLWPRVVLSPAAWSRHATQPGHSGSRSPRAHVGSFGAWPAPKAAAIFVAGVVSATRLRSGPSTPLLKVAETFACGHRHRAAPRGVRARGAAGHTCARPCLRSSRVGRVQRLQPAPFPKWSRPGRARPPFSVRGGGSCRLRVFRGERHGSKR